MQFRGEYYVTGDRAKMDEEGYFWFEGRGDDIIVSSGYTIGPFEVEEALCNIRQLENAQLSQAQIQPEEMLLKLLLYFGIQNEKMKKALQKKFKTMLNH